MATDLRAAYEQAYRQAFDTMPMPRLLGVLGMAQFNLEDRRPAEIRKEPCPFCGAVGKFSVFKKGARWFFGCFNSECAARSGVHGKDTLGRDEIALIAIKEGIDRKAAGKRYLELAGVTVDLNSPATDHHSPEPSSPGVPPTPTPPLRAKGNAVTAPDPDSIWGVLHSRLILNAADRKRLRDTRGASDEVIDELGFKSNNSGNQAIIEGLRELFPIHQLIEAGLYKQNPNNRSAEPVIETQFTGRGITGQKDENGKDIWGVTNPILIPYLDAHHKVTFLRPHKGNIAKRDKLNDDECLGHIYCPYLLASRIDACEGLCVLTESEFKAAALWQCGFAAIGIPGVSFVKNPVFRQELVDILSAFKVTELVIVFDNEVKDTPGVGKYIADPDKREWPIVWARYLAWDLMKKSPRPYSLRSVKIGYLPDEWRKDDEGIDRGKIDWDTALADFVRRAKSVEKGTSRARRAFQQVIQDARSSTEIGTLFPDERHRIQERLLNQVFYDPVLKFGTEKQEKLAFRFDKINGNSMPDVQQWAREMSKACRSVKGCYFIRKEPTDKFRAKLTKIQGDLSGKIKDLKRSSDRDIAIAEQIESLDIQHRLIREKLAGVPEPISNFVAKCEYVLHTVDRETFWMVSFANTQNEKTGLIKVPGESLGRLASFREWCLTHAHAVPVWFGGEKDLQSLMRDLKHSSARRNIYEVDHYGYHSDSKIWFFGTSAYAPDGRTIFPDENNIFWHDGIGYLIQSRDDMGKGFEQGAPILTPRKPNSDEPDPKQVFENLIKESYDCVGDYDAWLAIGMLLAYGAMPEIFRDHGAHPGLWIYGKRGSGKTQFTRRLMRIWGFGDLGGTRIDRGTTAVGMQRNLNQYSFLPFFFDEYRRNIPDVELKEAVLRGAYDRSSASKGRMDQTNRTHSAKVLTMPIQVGENSSSDGACRSRFAHILVAESRRRDKEAYTRLLRMADQLYVIGRHIMTNRGAFAESVSNVLTSWIRGANIKDERTKFVHGVGYAAFVAFSELISCSIDEPAFAKYLENHATQAFEDVLEETMLNRFWQDVISGLQRENAIDKNFFQEKVITLDEAGRYDPSLTELGGAKTVSALLIAAQVVYDQYAKDLRQRGREPELSKHDISREMSKESYWIHPGGASRTHRLQVNKQRYNGCWVLGIDAAPFGSELSDALEGTLA